jgi:hypothetical protein
MLLEKASEVNDHPGLRSILISARFSRDRRALDLLGCSFSCENHLKPNKLLANTQKMGISYKSKKYADFRIIFFIIVFH